MRARPSPGTQAVVARLVSNANAEPAQEPCAEGQLAIDEPVDEAVALARLSLGDSMATARSNDPENDRPQLDDSTATFFNQIDRRHIFGHERRTRLMDAACSIGHELF